MEYQGFSANTGSGGVGDSVTRRGIPGGGEPIRPMDPVPKPNPPPPDANSGGTTGGGAGGVGSGGTNNDSQNLANLFANLFGGANDSGSSSVPAAPQVAQYPEPSAGPNWALIGVLLAVATLGVMWWMHHKKKQPGKAAP